MPDIFWHIFVHQWGPWTREPNRILRRNCEQCDRYDWKYTV